MLQTTTKDPNDKVMPSGYFRLKGDFFDDSKFRGINRHKLSQVEGISYPTLIRYLKSDDEVTRFNGEVLYAILVTGMGYTIEEIAEMPIGKLFDIIEKELE